MIQGGFIPSTACDPDTYIAFVRDRLGVELTDGQQRLIRDLFAARKPDDRLTVIDIEQQYGINCDAWRKRRSRGQVRPVSYTRDRHAALYLRRDVEHALGNADNR